MLAQSDTLRILFVGNSYTYFWNLSQTVEALSIEKSDPLIARNSTAGGASLKDHWKGRLELNTRAKLAEEEWDIVVLQNHSRSSIDSLSDFVEYGNRFIELVKSIGAQPVLYETWAREYNPIMQTKVSRAYDELAGKHDIKKVPVGTLWQKARQLRPDLPLFDPDKSHPSSLGTYFNACIFYSFLTGNPADGLPERVMTEDKNGEILYLSIQSLNDAKFLQDIIDEYLKIKLSND